MLQKNGEGVQNIGQPPAPDRLPSLPHAAWWFHAQRLRRCYAMQGLSSCCRSNSSPGFWFDSSISEQYPSKTSPSAGERLWPYTMDYGVPQDCAIRCAGILPLCRCSLSVGSARFFSRHCLAVLLLRAAFWADNQHPIPSPAAAPASATRASAILVFGSSPCGMCRTRPA